MTRKVKTRVLLSGEFNDLHYECEMEDGSIWRCDTSGKNWKQIEFNNEELTEKFNKEVI